ncbi:CaiB/BaiF CoA transferase family protein [Sphingosinithalassobacter portus]|uniref:CaiB/BaiF CoA transferase family protein n=1 Tax=Stakelama portus TaxID=2676234 RepID=UPI000D6E82FF|nr:CoA transferase [Sphingosinithalassobacter portus]
MAKLSGITVVDCSQFLPGPMLTQMMADHGAQVCKIEPIAGDPVRQMEPVENGHSVWFRNVNRGKSARALDLKSEPGKAALWALLETADVFVEGFRPGVMERLGFGYQTVAQRCPRLVYCSISAFGQNGPLSHHPAHDLVVQALAGFISVNDVADGAPAVPGVPSADMAASLNGLSAVLMALIGRERSGRGDYLDIAMFDSLLPWCVHVAGEAIAGGAAPVGAQQRSLGGAALYQVYETSDRRYIVLGGREEKFARNLFTALDRPDLVAIACGPAGEAQTPAIDFLRATFRTRTRDEWSDWFSGRDIAFAPVLDFAEALQSPQVAARGLWRQQGGAHHIAPSFRFADEDNALSEPPALGGSAARA